MGKTILITGGARSGKSVIAEARALSFAPRAIYIATAEPRDSEMAARITAHRDRRGENWQTCAEPLDLTGALAATDSAKYKEGYDPLPEGAISDLIVILQKRDKS